MLKISDLRLREIIGYGLAIIFLILWQRKEVKIVEITLPVRENTKIITSPAPIVERNTMLLTNFETVRIKEPLNDTLVRAYLAQKDSLSRLNNFIDATRQRDYVELLEDSLQTITVQTRVNGFMREQVIEYKTKKQDIKIQVPHNSKGLYLGGFLTFPQVIGTAPSIGVKGDLIINKFIISGGYDTNKTIVVGTSIKLF